MSVIVEGVRGVFATVEAEVSSQSCGQQKIRKGKQSRGRQTLAEALLSQCQLTKAFVHFVF